MSSHLNRTNLEYSAIAYLKEKFKIKTMIDIGCGPGGMVDLANKRLNIDSWGIDADPGIKKHKRIIIHNFEKPYKNENLKTYDLAYSVEFLEHVDKQYSDNYMKLFQQCKYAVISVAPPLWPGIGHINCQDHEHWIRLFNEYGFVYDPAITIQCRKKSDMNANRKIHKQFFGMRCLFFRNIGISWQYENREFLGQKQTFPTQKYHSQQCPQDSFIKFINNVQISKNIPNNLNSVKENIFYVGHYTEFPVKHMHTSKKQVPNHTFKSTIPVTSILDETLIEKYKLC